MRLQDAIDTIWIPTLTVEDECKLRLIKDAARRVANPDYATLFAAWWKNDHILNEQERLTLAFDAALGITEDAHASDV